MNDAELSTTPMVASSAAMANSSFTDTTKKWTRWASTFFKKEKPLGSEPWFNPEADTKQKREWLEQQQAQAGDATSWPEHIYENFYVLGLPPDLEVTQIAEQLCDAERKQRHHHDGDADADHDRDYIQPPQPSLTPQVLFRYPAGSAAPISDEEVAALAFPTGVAPEKLKRTASLSALDELIMGRDSDAQQQCFVFMLKVGGNFPLYGCCWYVREMLHRPPYLAQQRYRSCKAPFRQCMIAAPRCYCLLSHYPFFELHFRVLKIILDLERLERLLEYDTEKSKLPPPVVLPSAARSSAGGRPSSPAGASLSGAFGGNVRASQSGMSAGGQPRPPPAHGHMGAPVVHNRHSYCVDCAGIIEDMCPFTPGVSPVPGSAPLPQGSRKQRQAQHTEQPHQGRMLQQGALQQPQQSAQIMHLQQQSQQQQTTGVQGVQPGGCEVCSKPLWTAQTAGDAGLATDSLDGSSSTAPAGAAGMAATNMQELTGKRPSAAAAGSAAAAAGPLEVGVTCQSHLQPQQEQQQQQQQTQQSSMPGFAAGKIWAAQTGLDANLSQQPVFDAVAASAARFDSVAAATAVGSSNRSSSAGAAEQERRGSWHNVVAAVRGAASAPVAAASASSAGQADRSILATGSEPVQPQETSLVQRMWDVWAPKTAPGTPSGTPRASALTPRTSGLAGFLRRSSRTSTSQLFAQPEQHELNVQHHKQQQQEGSNHVQASYVHSNATQQQNTGRAHQQQVSAMQQLQLATGLNVTTGGPAEATGQAAVDVAPAGQEDPACGLDSRSTASQRSTDTTATGDTAHAAAVVTADPGAGTVTIVGPTDVQNKASNVPTDPAVSAWTQDPELRPLRSFQAVSGSATNSQDKGAAAGPTGQMAGQNCPDIPGPLAAGVAVAPITAGLGSSVLAGRAVHKHSSSVASNASSFHSALEQLDSEHAPVASASSVQPTLQTLVSAAEELQQQQPAGRAQRPQELELPPQVWPQDSSISLPLQKEQRSRNGTLHDRQQLLDWQQPQQASLGRVPSACQVPLSPATSCSDGERLVSAFAAIAAIAAPFAAATAGGNDNASSQHNGRLSPVAQAEAPAGGDQLLQPSVAALDGVSVELPRSPGLEPNCSDDADVAQMISQGPLSLPAQLSRGYSQPSTGSDTVATSCSEPLEQRHEQGLPPLQPQASVHIQPLSRNVSSRRSAMFQEVTLRRSGEMSTELCRTISHLVQVDSTSLLSAYRSSPVPLPGELYRLMLGDLYRLEFQRVLPQPQYTPPGRSKLQHEVLSYAEVECAQQLQLWTVAALCRSLSLENILTMLNAVLLEKQLVVFCPHIGTLAAIVLSLVPMLRPFSWQSLMLPVTPTTMMGFLEAPVPFVLGVQYKTPGVVSRCHGLMRVNVYKNGIKNAAFPSLANSRQLMHALAPHYSTLCEAAELAVERPVHVITPDEEEAASKFLSVLHGYLSQLCGDLRLHTIVNVGMTKRTGVFMKDSLIDSLQPKDRPFMRAFVETQMFAVYADGVISDYCET